MLTPTRLVLTINCAAIGDSDVHHIQLPANSTFADLKTRLVAASPALAGMPLESFTLLLTRYPDGRWLSRVDPQIHAITAPTGGIESLLTAFAEDVADGARIADTIQLQQPRPPTEIHTLAYSLGNAQHVNEFTGMLRWLRRLQTIAAVMSVLSSAWAAVDALSAKKSLGIAACIAAIATAITGGAATAIQVYERRRARAIAEAGATPIV